MANEVSRPKKVQEAEIESKDQRWHVRNRLSLVFGSNYEEELSTYLYGEDGSIQFVTVAFHQAKSKAIEEIIDNAIDEYYRGHVTQITVSLSADGREVTVSDNGIGFALDKIKQVYTEFRTGSKFRDEETDEKGRLFRTLGQNGLGAAATCLTSDEFEVTVKHYNSRTEQTYRFLDGALKVNQTRPKPFTGPSGVTVSVRLSDEVYRNSVIDAALLRKRLIDLAINNPGLAFVFNGEKYLYKQGMLELAKRIDAVGAQLIGQETYDIEKQNSQGKKVLASFDFSLAFVFNSEVEDKERVISFVNSTPTFDGGYHVDRLRRFFVASVKEKAEKLLKKEKIAVIDFDVLQGVHFAFSVVMPNPRFESQTKRKLVRDQLLEKALDLFLQESVEKFLKKNKDYLDYVAQRATSRHRLQELKEASKQGKKSKKTRVDKLLDANERKDRSQCVLFICEGDSAIGGLRSARDKMRQGGIALKGKPMNVSQSSIKDVLANQEFADIMASIGLTIGQRAESEALRYRQIVFLADSDVDGGHINTLLANFFFTYWPELFEQEMIYLAKAPLFEVITQQGVKYARTEEELEQLKQQLPAGSIKEIQRNKGLGEMSQEAWKFVVSGQKYWKLSAAQMKESQEILNICFGKESQLRKDLLLDQ